MMSNPYPLPRQGSRLLLAGIFSLACAIAAQALPAPSHLDASADEGVRKLLRQEIRFSYERQTIRELCRKLARDIGFELVLPDDAALNEEVRVQSYDVKNADHFFRTFLSGTAYCHKVEDGRVVIYDAMPQPIERPVTPQQAQVVFAGQMVARSNIDCGGIIGTSFQFKINEVMRLVPEDASNYHRLPGLRESFDANFMELMKRAGALEANPMLEWQINLAGDQLIEAYHDRVFDQLEEGVEYIIAIKSSTQLYPYHRPDVMEFAKLYGINVVIMKDESQSLEEIDAEFDERYTPYCRNAEP